MQMAGETDLRTPLDQILYPLVPFDLKELGEFGRYHGVQNGTEGRGRRGKKRSLQTNRKGISQGHQEHVGWDCAWGQAQGEGLHVGAGEERTAEARGLIEEADYGAGARG